MTMNALMRLLPWAGDARPAADPWSGLDTSDEWTNIIRQNRWDPEEAGLSESPVAAGAGATR